VRAQISAFFNRETHAFAWVTFTDEYAGGRNSRRAGFRIIVQEQGQSGRRPAFEFKSAARRCKFQRSSRRIDESEKQNGAPATQLEPTMTMPHDPADSDADSPVESLTKTIRSTLQAIDELTGRKYKLLSDAAVELLVGTALKESGGLRWRTQLSGGPARGLFQMERATYDDIWTNYLAYRTPLGDAITLAFTPAGGKLGFDQITHDDAYAALMARLKYLRVPAALPPAGDLHGQAGYWKTYYNTNLGKGTAAEYVTTWKTYAG
jgi:hypothetical protein